MREAQRTQGIESIIIEGVTFPSVILVFAAKSTNLTRLPNPTVVRTNESTCDLSFVILSVPFPEVRNRKGTESGLAASGLLKNTDTPKF